MRNYLKAVSMIVAAPTVIISASAAFTLLIKFAVELYLPLPAKLALMAGPSILRAAHPSAVPLNNPVGKHRFPPSTSATPTPPAARSS